jgi:hypothetical protein
MKLHDQIPAFPMIDTLMISRCVAIESSCKGGPNMNKRIWMREFETVDLMPHFSRTAWICQAPRAHVHFRSVCALPSLVS